MSTEHSEQELDGAEVERLRERVAQLEDELASLQAWANGVVAEAQKQVYWLDRLHLDLDPIMRHVPFDFAIGLYQSLRDRYYRARARAGAVRRFVRRLSP
jgi:hypothetical protein